MNEKLITYAINYAKKHYYMNNRYEQDPSISLDDIIQECLIATERAEKTFDPSRNVKETVHLHNVLNNHMLNFLQREVEDSSLFVSLDEILEDRVDEVDDDITWHDVLAADQPSVEEEVLMVEQSEYIENLLSQIPDEDNAYIIRRVFFGGATQEEVASELGLQQPSLQKRLQSTLHQLRELTDGHGIEEFV